MTPQELVTTAVTSNWPEFQKRHPALARELTQADYVFAATGALRNDASYRLAIARGTLASDLADFLAHTADRVVKTVMRITP